jgi:hypothetical protein
MQLKALKTELKELGYDVKMVKDRLLVHDTLENTKFYIADKGEFLQIMSPVILSEKFMASPFRNELLEFLLRLHSRTLGCRIARYPDGDICLVADLYPDHQDADHIDNVFSRIHIFSFTFLEVIKKVGKTGRIPSVAEMDKLIAECQSENHIEPKNVELDLVDDDFDIDLDDSIDDFDDDDDDDFDYDGF